MDGRIDQLEAITRDIVNPDISLADLIPRAEALRDLIEGVTRFQVDWERDPAPEGTRLDTGLAISATYAAMCIRELSRTAAFIRGLANAIEDARRPDRPVRVLYAGCGPYALLALPLMTVFPREQVIFTLLDVHQGVLDSALKLIDSFGFAGHVAAAVCADATRYPIPAESMPDVIVSETMAVCLHNEPQVSIARHLLSQAPHALMVPQSVSVQVCALDFAREFRLMPSDHVGEVPAPERDRLDLGTVFELDAAHIRRWAETTGDRLPAGRVSIPPLPGTRRRLFLRTHIAIYGDTRLQDYDCSLTVPQRLRGGERLSGGEVLQFHYLLGAHPELGYEVLGGGLVPAEASQ